MSKLATTQLIISGDDPIVSEPLDVTVIMPFKNKACGLAIWQMKDGRHDMASLTKAVFEAAVSWLHCFHKVPVSKLVCRSPLVMGSNSHMNSANDHIIRLEKTSKRCLIFLNFTARYQCCYRKYTLPKGIQIISHLG